MDVAVGIGWATAAPGQVVVALVLAVQFAVRLRDSAPLLLGAVGMLALLAVPVAKELVGRARPPAVVLAQLPDSPAFPSGHAATSAVFAGVVYLLAAPHLTRRGRRTLAVAALCYTFVVGLSRVYLGVHWFTDVVAGWALGAFVVGLLAALAPGFSRTGRPRAR
ncbi:MAG: phosphatase PAP2 family protein [Streptosporangiales bacterium]|nr:phosphatase PAP2 family protein [Streptosporangiales bacterium]